MPVVGPRVTKIGIKAPAMQMGGSPLQYSLLPKGQGTPSLVHGASNYYEVVNDPGKGGLLATPPPYKAKPSCPKATPALL